MMKKSIASWGLLVTAVLIFAASSSNIFADDTGDPPSTKSSGNIGAWYDEEWEAVAFYRLRENSSTPNSYSYEYVYDPFTNSLPTYTETDAVADTSTSSGHRHNYSTSASIPQDMVVTEWSVTGHVHFKSGI